VTIDAQWLQLMPSVATYANVASRDVYGTRTTGTPVSFHCHVSLKRLENQIEEGNTVAVSGSVIMDDVYDIQKGAILTLPDGSTPRVTAVSTFFDENGPHHTTVEFGG